MPHFDPDKPHSEVHGIVGVRFVQGGHTFNSSGEHVPDPEAGQPKLDPGPTVTETFIPRAVESPAPVILGPDGLPAERVATDEGHDTSQITQAPQDEQPSEPTISKDDMRLKENKIIKVQWEQYHEGEEWPGLAEAKRQLGVK